MISASSPSVDKSVRPVLLWFLMFVVRVRCRTRVSRRLIFTRIAYLRAYIRHHIKNAYHEEPFCFIGDFNSRTGFLDDFITFDSMVADKYGLDLCNNDLIESKQNIELQNIMTDRVSQDKCVNKNGVRFIELCQHFDLKIVNDLVVIRVTVI